MKTKNTENRIESNEAVGVEAYGTKGLKSIPWTRTFKNADALNAWLDKNDAKCYATRTVGCTTPYSK